ncbi:MAG TPA: SRPBCC family protein [Acidimicrobiales bacterium]|nr:SRPBCC family protein [Acidimicrobiales bacterium]
MDVTAELVAPCGVEELFTWVGDLVRYPDWLDIVPTAVPAEPHPDDRGPAWSVDLRGQMGPFARSKRLRMVRVTHQPPLSVRFERVEHDGRHHSDWALQADVVPLDPENAHPSSLLRMQLHYGGALGGPIVEKLLADEITRSRPRLIELVEGSQLA